MTRGPRQPRLVAALAVSVVALVGSVTLVAAAAAGGPSRSPSFGGGTSVMGGAYGGGSSMMGGAYGGGSSMMGGASGTGAGSMMGGSGMGQVWLAGDGVAVTSIASAQKRAARAAGGSGLHPGEVIWFDNGFYVELKDAKGAAATEVIIDPRTGTVGTEPGPAMMWNTRNGTNSGWVKATKPAINAAEAQRIAARWLSANLPQRVAGTADVYPGYFTLETTTNGKIDGMLSVNAVTGAVWPHTWHGRFLAKDDS